MKTNNHLLRSLLTLPLFVLASQGRAVTANQFEYGSYFRTGVGTDNKGGSLTCFSNPLASGHNDFRLGNECGNYSELKLRAMPIKGQSADDAYFAAETMFSFSTLNAAAVETANPSLAELYIEGGNLWGTHQKVWVGKRYYRDIDAHMDDFFYYGGITGNGAGIEHIETAWGRFAAAWFAVSPATAENSQTHYFDFRLSEAPVGEKHKLNFWLGAANQKASASYGHFSGLVLGSHLRTEITDGSNDLAVIFGNGLLSRFDLSESSVHAPGDIIGSSGALRVVDRVTQKVNDKWAFHGVGIFESRRGYLAAKQNGQYWSVGVRPVYFFNDNVHLAVEVGYDQAKDDGYNGGKSVGLTRLTIAPEIVANRDIWSRPALRLFYTTTFWNDDAKGLIGGTAYAADTHGWNCGVQGEIWF